MKIKKINEFKSNTFKEFDIVFLSEKIDNLSINTKGAIVFVYSDNEHYEVEFVYNNESIVKTVSKKQIILK